MQGIRPGPILLVIPRNKLIFYGQELLASRQTPKLEDHSLSAVRDCFKDAPCRGGKGST
jgi:hypothetical protein